MTNEQPKNNNPQLEIQRIYVKDISLETPSAPAIFKEACQPNIGLNLQVQINSIDATVYEVILIVTVNAKEKERNIFLVEVHQAGIFFVSGFEKDQQDHILNVYIPSILFPYARETVSDVVSRASFPQLLLAPVNFEAMYAQQKDKPTIIQ